jgi:hypothetical protein
MLYTPEAVGSNPISAIPSVSRCSSAVERRKSLTTTSSVFLESRPTAGAEYIGNQRVRISPGSGFTRVENSAQPFVGLAASGPTAGLEYMGSDVRKDVWVQIPPVSQDAVAELADAPEKL